MVHGAALVCTLFIFFSAVASVSSQQLLLDHIALRPQKRGGLLGTETGGVAGGGGGGGKRARE